VNGHPITTVHDIVFHGRDHRRRCRACVREAHDRWAARGRKPIATPDTGRPTFKNADGVDLFDAASVLIDPSRRSGTRIP
jgi:hypothetical protein